ncbi:MAG: bifunctional (p)ppGpp synthetase/guanosine-3',5'-bis(diphosphate) 3'-pyrophosphohydrolase [Betaproteobacteria bacterium]|nr:MAG: bifunctional (p)ppGpp synthetase/guanosine-3',5'-bis(diphosphate) 3'-pyrophosphohydrolase [Betaproteobacteria bacterium]
MGTAVHSAQVDLAEPALVPIATGLPEADAARLRRAYEFAVSVYADKLLGTGEPALEHALGLASSLAALRLDAETRIAGILFALPQYLADSQDKLVSAFGPAVAALVAGIAKLNQLRMLTRGLPGQEAGAARSSQAEVLRKMLLAMVEDIRVVLVRLASRTQTLRFLARSPDALRRPYAQETLDIFAPLASRLGIWQLKWELEDYAFRYLEPEVYKKIASMLDEKRDERENFIAGAVAGLDAELRAAGLRAEVQGRPKHIYSIYNKMRGKSLDFSELYDVRALRVLVDSVKDCYTALGIVHNLWTPIPKEFDDYISRPKSNDYRSLHTAVVGADGRALEVQIRTHDMHRHAELGMAAHWRYKEAGTGRAASVSRPDPFDEKIAWLRQVLAWRDDVVESVNRAERFKQTAPDDTVYVLTPQGRVLDLPQGSTPVDFAYRLHTDLGHHCRGAKVDGVMVPLNYRLANGQRVEIVAAKTGGPSRDWMNPALGYIHSSRARSKVRQWFNAQSLAETVAQGRAMVERELQRVGMTGANLDHLAQQLGYARSEELFAAAGREEIGAKQLQTVLRGAMPAGAEPESLLPGKIRADATGSGILIVGMDKLLTQLAKCCRPAPPDVIAGFVTRGRGVSIHRRNCRDLQRLAELQPERMIEAAWGQRNDGVFSVDIVVQAQDRQGLLRDISEVLAREKINVTGVYTQSKQHRAYMSFTVEVSDLEQLQRTLALVREVQGVLTASRR